MLHPILQFLLKSGVAVSLTVLKGFMIYVEKLNLSQKEEEEVRGELISFKLTAGDNGITNLDTLHEMIHMIEEGKPSLEIISSKVDNQYWLRRF